MRQVNTREDRLKMFNNLHNEQPFNQYDPSAQFVPPGFQDQFGSRAVSAGINAGDSTLNKQMLHAAVRENLFNNMKPLKSQIEEKSMGNEKSNMNERERRFMLREMERKKRLAGIESVESYGKFDANLQENGKENTTIENVNSLGNVNWKRPEETKPIEYPMNFAQPKEIQTPIHEMSKPPLPIDPRIEASYNEINNERKAQTPTNIFNQAYEREAQRKEREKEILKNEYLKAQSRSSQRSRRSEIAEDNINTGLMLGGPDPAAEKRKKQLMYREELESQCINK